MCMLVYINCLLNDDNQHHLYFGIIALKKFLLNILWESSQFILIKLIFNKWNHTT